MEDRCFARLTELAAGRSLAPPSRPGPGTRIFSIHAWRCIIADCRLHLSTGHRSRDRWAFICRGLCCDRSTLQPGLYTADNFPQPWFNPSHLRRPLAGQSRKWFPFIMRFTLAP